MIITVASGKGGTGKTTVAVSLALAISPSPVAFLDCDVEAPNAHLFLDPSLERRKEIGLLIPQVDMARCNGCERCAEVCQYHAIVVLAGKPLVFPELCHGCGSCTLNCPEGAISETTRMLGVLEGGPARGGIDFAHGVLNIGEPMAVPVISQLKNWNNVGASPVTIRDASPGTSCPVVEALRGSDFILLVTEPTPFGLHDLKLAVQVTEELGIPAGVVINRDGIGNADVDAFCKQKGLPILMRIPNQRQIAAVLAGGQPLVSAFPEYIPKFQQLYRDIHALSGIQEARP
ncbi:MAG: ATP-binding protein [Anaerolineales bacterium]|nr:ATP-binding protein [Anaerolineales bacterium]